MQPRISGGPRKLWAGGLIAAALALVVVSLVAALRQRSISRPQVATTPSDAGYVDSAVCANCHQDVVETYRKTGMGRSFSTPSAQNVAQDFAHASSLVHQPSRMRYSMSQRNGEFFVQRSQTGFDGKETNVMEERIDYVIGSGNHSHSFLHRAPDGQLIELPVSWYSEGSGYWAMSPGYESKDQSDFRRAIKPECMFCHNGYTMGDAGLERSIFPQKLPLGIDCQRCHGPGGTHVQAATSHAAIGVVRSSIVNPGHLSRERQMEVCMQCHLETSHHEPNDQRFFDRAVFFVSTGPAVG